MRGDEAEFFEAKRLALKFFPEAKKFVFPQNGLFWESFLAAMMTAEYYADFSCDLFSDGQSHNRGLVSKKGLAGEDKEVYLRLLNHSGIQPLGRAIVIPDAIALDSWSSEDCLPYVCHSKMLPKRLAEKAAFGQSRNTLVIFECGAAILVDHDERVHWAFSRIIRDSKS